MKRYTFLLLILLSLNLHATVRTVSNYPGTLAQFNTINAAITASASGDTIYVHGSPIQYNGFSISNKKLTILGPGFAPNVQGPYTAVISTTTNCMITGVGAKKSEIQGIIFLCEFQVNATVPDSLRFYRNLFSTFRWEVTGTTYKGYIFQDNFFGARVTGATNSNYQDILFENNIFRVSDYSVLNIILCSNVLFDHNLWFNTSSSNSDIFYSVHLVLFTNNIFVHRDISGGASQLTQSTFINNLTYLCGMNTPWTYNGNIDGGGNIGNTDPQMADQALVNNGNAGLTSNYTVASGPANNAGTDMKDLGLLYDGTGSLNWTNARNSRMPQVTLMNITNPVLGAGGTLNVNVEARKNE